jgi:S1-C subfamily serine protease/antitoxin component YwqK of YwqJK toxin-antitoxin module
MKRIIFTLLLLFTLALTNYGQTLKDEWVVCNGQGCKLLDPYFEEGVTFTWDGSCVNGKANGYGTAIKYENTTLHSTYTGEYANGIRSGAGKFVRHLSNETWEGNFINGQLFGYGKYKNENGNRYEGYFINYMQHGQGTQYYGNGGKFEGSFNSFTEYTGIFTYPNGDKKYMYRGVLTDRKISTNSNYSPKLNQEITEYFDENWERCEVAKAKFYRLITYSKPNTPKGKIIDFYMNGQKQSEFFALYIDYDDDNLNFHVGEAKWYHTNGKLSRICNYYQTNRIEGLDITYFDNGYKASEIYYSQGVLNGPYNTYYKTGKPKISAYYEDGNLLENKYIEFDENGLGALVYNENFIENIERWEVKVDGSSSQITDDLQVSLYLYNDNTTSRFNYITLDQNSSYSIESIIQKKSGKGSEGYGIIFGFKDWDNYFQFLISEYGVYKIVGQFEGVNIKICEWTESSAINIGNKRNLLKVMKFEDEFIFSINGEVVERPAAKDLRGNNIGITAAGRGEYILENIIVKEFMTAEELERKGPKNIASNANEWQGNGSGFFINEKGYIATNYHVVKDASAIQVEYFQKGIKNTFSAKVIVTDKQNDLAIIQIDDPKFKNLPSIPYVFSSTIKDVGSEVFALGYPIADVMGEEIKFTDGKISSKTGIEGDVTVYQISVPIQPGNSGGPLFDNKGNLVGITSSALNKEYFNSENVNYAIKTTYLKNLIDVMPESITLPNSIEIYNKPLTEKIKLLSDFIPIIRVK